MSKRKPRQSTLEYRRQVQGVIEEFRDYWPLTLRQVYYQLVAAGVIENNRNSYQKLSRNLSQARLDGSVPWEALEDRARSFFNLRGWHDDQHFIQDQVEEFLCGYRRDMLQSQDEALEIWVEKDALSQICYRAALPYSVPVVVARGFASISYKHECRKRVLANAEAGKPTRILYFGDLDPSGWAMLPAMMDTLRDDMGLTDTVTADRCALTLEQVSEYNLPRNPEALKKTDPRAKKYCKRFGDLAVELDALPPPVLEDLVRKSIENHLDMDRLEAERQHHDLDQQRISAMRQKILDVVAEQ